MEKITGLPTYQQQFNKITEAYIKGEILPFKACFCFIGNLLNKTDQWVDARNSFCDVPNFFINNSLMEKEIIRHAGGLYKPMEIAQMETLFCRTYQKHGKTEDALFIAMCAALEVLKQIHIERGEVIDDAPVFTKRELQTV